MSVSVTFVAPKEHCPLLYFFKGETKHFFSVLQPKELQASEKPINVNPMSQYATIYKYWYENLHYPFYNSICRTTVKWNNYYLIEYQISIITDADYISQIGNTLIVLEFFSVLRYIWAMKSV